MQTSRQRDLEGGWPDPEGKYSRTPKFGLQSTAAAHASLVGKPPAAAAAPAPAPVMDVKSISRLSDEGWPDDLQTTSDQDAVEDPAPEPLTEEQELEELDDAIKACEARRALLRERVSSRAMAARARGGR